MHFWSSLRIRVQRYWFYYQHTFLSVGGLPQAGLFVLIFPLSCSPSPCKCDHVTLESLEPLVVVLVLTPGTVLPVILTLVLPVQMR